MEAVVGAWNAVALPISTRTRVTSSAVQNGPRLAGEGAILPGGRVPIATFGGLKARGHPVGATGVYQLAEVTRQLWGEAGECQIEGARIGMAQNIGGSGATIVTHILRQD